MGSYYCAGTDLRMYLSLQVYMGCDGKVMGYGIRAASRSVGTGNFGIMPEIGASSLGAAEKR